MNDGYAGGKPGEKKGFLQRAITSAYDCHLFILEEETIAGGAIGNTFSGEQLLPRDAKFIRAGACRDYQCFCFKIPPIGFNDEWAAGKIHRCRGTENCFRTEFLRLLLEKLPQVHPTDPFWKSWIVLDSIGQRSLATQGCACYHTPGSTLLLQYKGQQTSPPVRSQGLGPSLFGGSYFLILHSWMIKINSISFSLNILSN